MKTTIPTDLERYKEMFFSYPTLKHFWNASEDRPDIGAMKSARGLSSGEVVIVKCLVSIWRGDGHRNEVDITDVMALPDTDRKPIIMALINPVRP